MSREKYNILDFTSLFRGWRTFKIYGLGRAAMGNLFSFSVLASKEIPSSKKRCQKLHALQPQLQPRMTSARLSLEMT